MDSSNINTPVSTKPGQLQATGGGDSRERSTCVQAPAVSGGVGHLGVELGVCSDRLEASFGHHNNYSKWSILADGVAVLCRQHRPDDSRAAIGRPSLPSHSGAQPGEGIVRIDGHRTGIGGWITTLMARGIITSAVRVRASAGLRAVFHAQVLSMSCFAQTGCSAHQRPSVD